MDTLKSVTLHALGRPAARPGQCDVRPQAGERRPVTMAQIFLAPGGARLKHHHENEQFSYILKGTLRFWIGDEEKVIDVKARRGAADPRQRAAPRRGAGRRLRDRRVQPAALGTGSTRPDAYLRDQKK